MDKNLSLLSACNFCGLFALFVNVGLCHAIGQRARIWPSLPFGVLVSSGMLIIGVGGFGAKKFGYKFVFLLGALAGLSGGALCWLSASLVPDAFPKLLLTLFVVGAGLQGASYGLTNYYRHEAALMTRDKGEGAESRAISMVLAWGVLAGLTGPGMSVASKTFLTPRWSYVFLLAVVAGVHAVHALLVSRLKFSEEIAENSSFTTTKTRRCTFPTLFSFAYFNACFTGTVSQGVMIFSMTITPTVLPTDDADRIDIPALVICVHAVCMFSPSLLTNLLINRLGADRTALIGNALGVLGVGMFSVDCRRPIVAYATVAVAMATVGFAWNLGFVSGTTLLVGSYESTESSFAARAINDTCLFGFGGAMALSGGFLTQNGRLRYAIVTCVVLYTLAAACNVVHRLARFRNDRPVASVKYQYPINDIRTNVARKDADPNIIRF